MVYLRPNYRRTLQNQTLILIFLTLTLFVASCQEPTKTNQNNIHAMALSKDIHSFSNPNEVAIKHMYLNLDILFDSKVLKGFVELTLDNKKATKTLHLDSRQLNIDSIYTDDLVKQRLI